MCYETNVNQKIFGKNEITFLLTRRYVAAWIAGKETREDDREAVMDVISRIIMVDNTTNGEETFRLLCGYIHDENIARSGVSFMPDQVLAERLPQTCAANSDGRPARHAT